MKKWCILLAILTFLGLKSFAQEEPNAKQIIHRAEQKLNGKTNQSEIKMTIIRPSWKREIKLKTWGIGADFTLILLSAPARDKGIAFLKREKEIWNWQPSIDRVIKLPPSMMMQSWMGSDFTNDDLVQQSDPVEDYSHKILGSEEIEGRDCYILEMIPHEDAAVVWGKLIVWVDKADYMELKTEFFDEDDYLVNTMLGKQVKLMDGKLLPSILEVIPAEEEGKKTIVEYLSISFDKPLKTSFFSIQNMKRLR